MADLQNQVRLVRIRQQKQWLWQNISKGLMVGGIASSCVALTSIAMSSELRWTWLLGPISGGAALGFLYGMVRFKSIREAAQTIDRKCNLKDRASTALQFKSKAKTDQLSQIQNLQVEDAEVHASRIDPCQVVPYHAPRSWSWAIAATVLAGILAVFPDRSHRTVYCL